jgi:uncharacterized protein (DUF433 family)
MSTMDQLRTLFLQISDRDRAQFMAWLASWEGAPVEVPGIASDATICGGDATIVRTRIPVWVLEQMRRLGIDEEDILRSYPTLRADDLLHAWMYVERHRDEIDQRIEENERA